MIAVFVSQPHEPHRLVHRSSVGADAARALSAPSREQPQQLGLVGPELRVALLHRREQLDDGLADVLLELAVAAVAVVRLDLARACGPEATERMSIRFETPGLSSARRTSRPESVTAERNFLRIDVGLVEHPDRALRRAAGRRHLPGRLLQVHDPGADLGVDALAAR